MTPADTTLTELRIGRGLWPMHRTEMTNTMPVLNLEGTGDGAPLALVTGASGCVGRMVVANLLEKGWRIRSLVRRAGGWTAQRVQEFVGDLADPGSLAGACDGVDLVVHAGAYLSDWRPGPQIWTVNRDGTRALCAEALQAGVRRLVYVSTVDVFGFSGSDTIDEFSPKRCPRNPYSASKLAGEHVVWSYERRGLEVTVVYPAWVFGPGDRHFLPELVEGLRSGQLVHFGRGAAPLELTFNANLADAIVLAGIRDEAAGRRYIVSDGFGMSTGELFDRVAEQYGLLPPTRSVPRWAAIAGGAGWEAAHRLLRRTERPLLTRYAVRSIASGMTFDTSRIRSLGWEPTVDFGEALRQAIDDLDPAVQIRFGQLTIREAAS